jgi:hypothetical protein
VTDLVRPAVEHHSPAVRSPKTMGSFVDHFWNPQPQNQSEAQAHTTPNGFPAFEPNVLTLEDDQVSDLDCFFLTDQPGTQQGEFLETALSNLQQGQTSGTDFNAAYQMANKLGIQDVLQALSEGPKEGDVSGPPENSRGQALGAAVAQQITVRN